MLEIQVHNAQWLDHLSDLKQNQIPFALKNAINTLATNVQGVERKHMREIFTVRRADWIDRSVKITKFATKQDPVAIIGIHPPGGDSRADIITKFEDETEKLPRGHQLAIPVEARRNKSDIVLKSQRPGALRGNDKVFVIQKPNGVGLILQRVTRGARKGMNKLLYLLVPKARITPDLQFEANAKKTIDASAPAVLDAAIDQAIKTAK